MKLTQVNDKIVRNEFKDRGYSLPEYDSEKLRTVTHDAPTWVHFGTGNIFRAFPAAVLNELINKGV